MFLYDLKINIQTNCINTRHRIACDIYTLEQTTGAVIHLRIHTRIGTHGEEILTTGVDTQTFHILVRGNRNRITDCQVLQGHVIVLEDPTRVIETEQLRRTRQGSRYLAITWIFLRTPTIRHALAHVEHTVDVLCPLVSTIDDITTERTR